MLQESDQTEAQGQRPKESLGPWATGRRPKKFRLGLWPWASGLSLSRLVYPRPSPSDRGADERALLAGDESADAGACAGRSADAERGLLPASASRVRLCGARGARGGRGALAGLGLAHWEDVGRGNQPRVAEAPGREGRGAAEHRGLRERTRALNRDVRLAVHYRLAHERLLTGLAVHSDVGRGVHVGVCRR